MSNTNRYVSGMFLAAAIIAFGSFYFLRGAVKTVRQAEFDMSFSMPRPKSALYNFFFGLEGREINRKEINPFSNTDVKTEAAGVRKDAPKIDPKKQAAAQKAAQKPILPAPPAAKPKVDVTVVGEATATLGGDSVRSGEATQAPAPTNFQAQTTTVPVGAQTPVDKDGMSAAQWRALVVGQPTRANVLKLVSAFNNKQVDSAALYTIMNDLLQSSNPETQGLGLVIGQSVPSLRSFSIVSNSYDRLDPNVKKSADSYLATYMQTSRLSILALALQSDDSQVVLHAAQVMVAGLEKVKNGQTNPNDGNRYDSGRGVVASGTGKTYTQFVSILQDLTTSGDSTIVGLAQNALTQIQSLSNT
ncbi:hypothetical protein [Bdellovibrio sp. HCB337]|uniref:hypothetical protein n=1 Tax=Bdellovibrio sp. HCB337 TaxID=3394358 RepID=UPI0039A4F853